ncbi:MAG: AAA family ATPase, partial [Ruminococcus sp.]|nr:AAA family ATPase [Ruminococcus sp.]
MYTEKQLELLEKVEKFKAEEELSQNEAGRIIGVSGSTLSQIKNGTYKADPQGIFDIIEKYFEVKEKAKLTYSVVEYAPTSISEQIYNVISLCQIKGGLAVVVGDAGIGKSKAIQKFTADNPTSSFSITVNPCFSNIKSMLKLIANTIGAVPKRSSDELWLSIVDKLTDGTVLIFDEAQHLNMKTIEVLRSFSDYFNDRHQTLGICFIGNIEIIERFDSKKFGQIINRTKQSPIFHKSDITHDDIKKIFPILEAKNMEKEIDYLYKVTQTEQALRGAINLFSNAYDNENITYEGLAAMADYMGIKV